MKQQFLYCNNIKNINNSNAEVYILHNIWAVISYNFTLVHYILNCTSLRKPVWGNRRKKPASSTG